MKKTKILIPLALSLLLAGCNNGDNRGGGSSNSSDSAASSTASSSDVVITTISLASSDGETSGTLRIGETLTLTASVTGADAKDVKFASSNPDVAKVESGSASGTASIAATVTALKAGSATITATIGDKSASFALTVPAQSLTIEGETSVLVGSSITLEAKATNIYSSDSAYAWSSSDSSIVSVASNGEKATVTGVKAGSATIKVTYGGIEATWNVTVPAQSLTITGDTSILVGDTIEVEAHAANISATDYVWSVDNTAIASIVGDGAKAKVTAIKAGSVNIKVKLGDVEASLAIAVPAQSLTIAGDSSVLVGASIELTATASNIVDSSFAWSIDDPSIATVTGNGDKATIVGVKAGSATVKVTYGGVEATWNVTVPAQSLTIVGNSTVLVGVSVSLEAKAENIYSTDSTYTWSVADDTVASITSNGNKATLTGLVAGKTTVTVVYGGVNKTIDITVPEEGLIIEGPKEVKVGASIELEAKASNIAGTTYDWSISDETVASITANGDKVTVTGLKAGKTTVKVKFGDVSATWAITVPEQSLKIEGDSSVLVGASIELTAKAENIVSTTYVWSVDDDSILTVTGDGDKATVTGVKAGSAKVKVKLGDVEASIDVTVPEQSLSIEGDATVLVNASIELEAKASNIASTDYVWSVDDDSIVSISGDGNKATVAGLKAGKATIKVTLGGVEATWEVTVPEQSLTITGNSEVFVGVSVTLEAKATNIYSSDSTYAWSVDDDSVVSVSGNGDKATVTGLKAGSTTVKVTYGGVEATWAITVPAQGLIIEGASEVKVGASVELSAKASNIAGTTYTWSTGDSSIATVSGNGDKATVTGVKAGSVAIKVTYGGVDATWTITVSNVDAESVSITNKSVVEDLPMRRSVKLNATISPDNTTFKDVTWSSSDASVASVDADGNVTGVKQGAVTITAKCGEKSDSVAFNVTDPVIKASEISDLSSSYKVSATHTYIEPIVHAGNSIDDPYSFVKNSSITMKDSSGADTETVIPTMHVTSTGWKPGIFVKFNIETAGTYGVFANSSTDSVLRYLYKQSDDGETPTSMVSAFPAKDNYDSTSLGANLCGTSKDFYYEAAFEVGSYIVNIGNYGGTAADVDLGVVKINTAEDGTKSVDASVTASGDPTEQTINDTYSYTYIDESIVYSENGKNGTIKVDGKAYSYAYDEAEDEYSYNNNSGVDGLNLGDTFSWDSLLSDPNLVWVSTDSEHHVDLYCVDFTKDLAESSPMYQFALAMGFADEIDAIYVASDYVDNKISFGVCFEGETLSTLKTVVKIEAATDSPVSVNGYDVTHGGDAGSDSGIDDNWGE